MASQANVRNELIPEGIAHVDGPIEEKPFFDPDLNVAPADTRKKFGRLWRH